MKWKLVVAAALWFMLVMVLVARADNRTHVTRQQECGGWENFMTVVVEQVDQTKCIAKANKVTETCYFVQVRIYPGDADQCTFNHWVMQSKVDNLVKDYMNTYLP